MYCLSIASKAAIKTWKLFSFSCHSCHLYLVHYFNSFNSVPYWNRQYTEFLTICLPVLGEYMGCSSLYSCKNLGIHFAEFLERDWHFCASGQEDINNEGEQKVRTPSPFLQSPVLLFNWRFPHQARVLSGSLKCGAFRLSQQWMRVKVAEHLKVSVPLLRFDSVKWYFSSFLSSWRKGFRTFLHKHNL